MFQTRENDARVVQTTKGDYIKADDEIKGGFSETVGEELHVSRAVRKELRCLPSCIREPLTMIPRATTIGDVGRLTLF